MTEYTTEQVIEYLHIYGEMVYLYETFSAGVMAEESCQNAQKAIDVANTRFPEELKDEKFKFYLNGLEKIVEVNLYNS